MENRCGNSWEILKVPARKEKESATIIRQWEETGAGCEKKYYLQASETKPDFLYLLRL